MRTQTFIALHPFGINFDSDPTFLAFEKKNFFYWVRWFRWARKS